MPESTRSGGEARPVVATRPMHDGPSVRTERRRRPVIDLDAPADCLHRELKASGDPDLEAALCRRYAGLAQLLADRFARVGADRDDLRQAAFAALLLALRRYDPERGVSFTTFAWSTISGELKRFHRSNGWGVQVSRRVQESYLEVATATEDLTHELGRSPTVEELAVRTELSPEAVIEALDARNAFRPLSIDAPSPSTGQDDDAFEWQLGSVDTSIASVEDVDMVTRLLARLSERERRLVDLRFRQNLSQRDIGCELGVSQMQVSRLLASVMTKLRIWSGLDGLS